jgi:hypothetical protein
MPLVVSTLALTAGLSVEKAKEVMALPVLGGATGSSPLQPITNMTRPVSHSKEAADLENIVAWFNSGKMA